MLKLLSVRNFAVIEAIELDFENGLNLLTGETGSGKSIIVDALGLLLGDRGSLSQIRSGEKSAFVEGVFGLAEEEIEDAREILEQAGLEFESDNEIIIRREVVLNGKARIVVNDRTVGLTVLRKLQPLLVEVHGQGEQKLLTSSRAQFDLLDTFAGCQALRKQVGGAFVRWNESLTRLQTLNAESAERERTLELLQHQLSEIEAVSPRDGEDEELLQQRALMANAEKLLENCGGAYNILYENDNSLLAGLGNITRRIREASELDKRLTSILNSLDESSLLMSEAAGALRTYVDGIDFSASDFTRVDNRLLELEKIKRKHGADLKAILENRIELGERIEELKDSSKRVNEIESELLVARKQYVELARKLSMARRTAAKKLEREVEKSLQHVALQNARLNIELKSAEINDAYAESMGDRDVDLKNEFFSAYGADTISFRFSANPGEDLRPLSQVASGGELSRLMLTLLTSSMKNAKGSAGSQTMIFDEIDSGIGGRAAEAVGKRLKALAETNQVLCVTHQAQIARFADAHFLVNKQISNGRTNTTVELLEPEDRIRELARMIAGDQEAKTTIETAKWMLETAGT